MSTQPSLVTVDPLDRGPRMAEVVGEVPRRDSPYPRYRVRIDGAGTWVVGREDVLD